MPAPAPKKPISVSSNLGVTRRGRPPVPASDDDDVTAEVPKKRDTAVVAVSSLSPKAREAKEIRHAGKRRRILLLPIAIGFAVVLVAAFFGGVLKMNAKERLVSTVSIITAEPSKATTETEETIYPPSQPQESVEDKAVVEEIPKTAPTNPEDEAVSTASPLERETIRFPGTYSKGEIHADINRWGKVDRLFQEIRKCKGTIAITGHTCAIGNEETNIYVSTRRAEEVARYFVKRGFSRQRLEVEGLGASMPIADNNTEAGREKNRRVEISCR
jgi:outer membrane protein OmpA-like peptidoglycan-associated protein